jgi:hypothetical protein
MKPFTVLLLYPDYVSQNYGQETYLAHVSAANPTSAVEAARQACRLENEWHLFPDSDCSNDMHALFVTDGHHVDLSGGAK